MVSADSDPQTPKRKATGYFLLFLTLALLFGNFWTWREVVPAKRELRKAQRFLDQQLNANRLRDLEASARGETRQTIASFLANGMGQGLCDAMTATEQEVFYAAETQTNTISLFSTNDDQSLVIDLSLFSTSGSVEDPEPRTVEIPLRGNTVHQLQLSNPDGRFTISLDDKEVLAQTLAEFDDVKLDLLNRVRQILTPGILTDEFDDYAKIYRHRRWKTLLVRTYAYHRTIGERTNRQFVAVTISVKSKGDLYVPQRFQASADRTVNTTWDDEKAHYRITGVKEK